MDSLSKAWTREEDYELLSAIIDCGFGNWTDIAHHVPNHTSEECEKHYFDNFVQDFRELRKPPLCSNNCKIKIIMHENNLCSSYHIWNVNKKFAILKEEQGHEKKTIAFGEYPHLKNITCTIPCTGYNNIRSDFMVEYDNSAENILALLSKNKQDDDVENEDCNLKSAMEYALLQSYNSRLRERNYRKNIIRNHALIDRRKTYSMIQRLEVPFSKHTLKVLQPIMRFLNGPEFDFLVERLKYQNKLRAKLNSYIECRKNGLKYLSTVDIFQKLKRKRSKYQADLLHESNILRLEDRTQRKPSQPLALDHLPGYYLLTEQEKILCSTNRIVPETYNSFKELLIIECKKRDGLKLAQARSLIKIDVNKTRKIYDHLISTKLIWQPDET